MKWSCSCIYSSSTIGQTAPMCLEPLEKHSALLGVEGTAVNYTDKSRSLEFIF